METAYRGHRSARELTSLVKLSCLFGGVLSQFGWLFFGFGMIFVWVFGSSADLSFPYASKNVERVAAQVGSSKATSYKVNNSYVYETKFSFHYQGQKHTGTSYSTGGSSSRVAIVPEGQPQYAVLEGQRLKPFGPFVLFVLIFPVIGLLLALFGLKRGKKALSLLQHGELAEGTYLRKEPTSTRINNRTVYKVFFEYTARDGHKYTVTDKTHRIEKVQDEAQERLIYDPHQPDQGMLLDTFPGKPSVSPSGQVTASTRSFLYCIIPGAAILGNGYYLSTLFS